ncbi:LmeA family phospholipid-binding protein [Micromonospora zhanjiangensis]|uniref:DUF2993 domain-containing protein n=1 Tax=Micromonospora zhanjiangensis TaxID=1522057 RepID=A0ABV8KEW4_9ACTN
MADSYQEYEGRPRRRGGRRVLIGFVVLILVLGGLLVVADRLAVGFAERAIADQVRQEVAKQQVQASGPDVKVGGFPFLTQVVNGRYEAISIVLTDLSGNVEGKAVSLPKLDIDARNVKASMDTLRTGQGEVVAESVKGTGTITYDSVTKLIDRKGIKLAGQDGKLTVTGPVQLPVVGEMTVHGTANLAVQKGQVVIKFERLTADGLPNIPLVQGAISTYAKQLSINVPLPPLPFGLKVQEVRPLPEGLAVTAAAQNVPLRSSAG